MYFIACSEFMSFPVTHVVKSRWKVLLFYSHMSCSLFAYTRRSSKYDLYFTITDRYNSFDICFYRWRLLWKEHFFKGKRREHQSKLMIYYVNVSINSICTPYWLSLLIGWSMFKAASIGTCCFHTNDWEMKMYICML